MELTKFIGRDDELRFLNEQWITGGFNFIPIYGRRRIGKTELILQFIKDKPSLYFSATMGTKKENIEKFKLAASPTIDLSFIQNDWELIFKYLSENLKRQTAVVIDEFPYLIESDPAISSVFQKIIDLHLKKSSIFLILCGSSVSMMYKEVLAYKAPLYGRRTGQIHLKKMNFDEVCALLDKPPEESSKIYGVCGGVPAYLNEFRAKRNFFSLIQDKILRKGSILSEEPLFLIRQEFQKPQTYLSILSAISLGYQTLGKIGTYCGFEKTTNITPYLHTLENLGHIKRELSVTDTLRSKKSVYKINDLLFRFWFQFIRKNQSLIEKDSNTALKKIRADYQQYMGYVFENICKEFISKKLRFTKIGRWWYKEKEIDIVTLDEDKKVVHFFEVKWKNLSENQCKKILVDLKKTSEHVKWKNEDRKEYFGVIAKKIENKETIRGGGFLVFDLDDFKN